MTTPARKSRFLTPLSLMLIAGTAFAQVPPGPPQGGRFDPAETQRRVERRLRDALDVDDAQWEMLEPRIARVRELRAALAIGVPGFDDMGPPDGGHHDMPPPDGAHAFDGPAGPMNVSYDPRSAGAPYASPVQQRYYDLQEALNDPSLTAEAYQVRIAALRQARTIAQGKLTRAQIDLRRRVTPIQEAVLITVGILD